MVDGELLPRTITGKLLTSWPSMIIMRVGSNFLRSGTIANRVDLAVQLYPGVVAPPIVLGTIGGMAGKVIIDLIRQGVIKRKSSSELLVPGFVWRSALLCAVLYYYTVHWTGLLTTHEGLALIRTLLIGHGILSSLSGMPLDVTQPLAVAVYKVSNIPVPLEQKLLAAPQGAGDGSAAPTKETKKNK